MRAQPIPVDVRPPPNLPVRAGMGSFLRAILEFLDQEGLREQVRARVSPETSRLMQAPPSIFSNLDRFFTLTTRGIAFTSRPLDQKTWVIKATLAGSDVPAAALHVLRGSLQYVFELTSSRGQVGGAEIRRQTAGSTLVAFQVCLES